MKLTSDQPYWLQRNKSQVEYPSLEGDTTCECVVVGAGVTGAMLGDRLARAGYDVIVVDRQTVCTGSTSASTALLLYDIDVPLVKLSELIGERNALRAYALSYQSIDAIEELALGLADDVDFRRNRSIYLAVDQRGADDIRREVEARSAAGMSVDYHQQPQLRDEFGLVGPAALSTAQAASCDPIRLARGLLTRAQANGARIFDDTQIVEFGYRNERVELTTKTGCRIQAEHGIIACGYESVRLISEPIVTLNNTYASSHNRWKISARGAANGCCGKRAILICTCESPPTIAC